MTARICVEWQFACSVQTVTQIPDGQLEFLLQSEHCKTHLANVWIKSLNEPKLGLRHCIVTIEAIPFNFYFPTVRSSFDKSSVATEMAVQRCTCTGRMIRKMGGSLFGKNLERSVVNKMLSYRRETALQGALQFSPKVEDWNWEMIFYGHYRYIFNHCDIIDLKICRILWKKTQNNGYYGVQGHSRSSRSVPIESPYAICY